jgi:hypothetical protein
VEEKYATFYDNAAGDELPQVAAKKYLLKHPSSERDIYLSQDRTYLKIAALEAYTRKAFFEFLSTDPKFVLETVFWYKPKVTAFIFWLYLSSLVNASTIGYIALLLVFLLLAGSLAADTADYQCFSGAVLLVTGAFFVSLFPILLTVPAMMIEQYYALLIVLGSWTVGILCATIRMCVRLTAPLFHDWDQPEQ